MSTEAGEQCDCAGTGYEGTQCELDIDECLENPCQNGGICENSPPGSFTCDCSATGFFGTLCESETENQSLPFWVTDHYAMSGKMGGGSNEVVDCDPETGNPQAACSKITWSPEGATWDGWFFQYPEGNWGDVPGLPITPGATHISFRAWGESGGETVSFGAGMMAVDGFEVSTGDFELTTTPETYTLSLQDVSYDTVAGGFSWYLQANGGTENITFYLDDVQWNTGAFVQNPVPSTGGPSIPMWVDDNFIPSGYMSPMGLSMDACAQDLDTEGSCWHVTWESTLSTWAGIYWQYPANNWGCGNDTPCEDDDPNAGFAIDAGATKVSCKAWLPEGAPPVAFKIQSGIAGAGDFGGNEPSAGPFTLTSEPQTFSVDISGYEYGKIAGAFAFILESGGVPDTYEIYLADIVWE